MDSLKQFTSEQLAQELKRRDSAVERQRDIWNKMQDTVGPPEGIWKVTTEGDCEGRTTKQLGTFKGHVADIAIALASQSCYGLRFEQGKEIELPKPNREIRSVNISFDINTGTWDDPNEDLVPALQQWMELSEPVNVHSVQVMPCNYHASVTLAVKHR
jgi:hypothetical protein